MESEISSDSYHLSDSRLDYLQNHHLPQKMKQADLSKFVRLMTDLLSSGVGYISILDENRVHYVESKNVPTDTLDRSRTPDESVVNRGAALSNRDLHNRSDGDAIDASLRYWRGWAAVPLRSRGNFVLGTVGIASRVPRNYDQSDIRCLHTVAWEVMDRFYNHITTSTSTNDPSQQEDSKALKLFTDFKP